MQTHRSNAKAATEPRSAGSLRGARSSQAELFTRDGKARRSRRGGARRGAGRPKSPHSGVPHRRRPKLSKHHPLHVTLRVKKDAAGLRGSRAFRAVRRALTASRERFGFRLVHYSVQGNHIHLIAEANDRIALTRGMQSLTIRVALATNRARARRGRVFGDRYHARQLRTPLEVRRALLYVLRNERKHLAQSGFSLAPWHFDPCSSAAEFDGWRNSELLDLARAGPLRAEPASRTTTNAPTSARSAPINHQSSARCQPNARSQPNAHDALATPAERVTVAPRAYLLRVAWKRHGLLGLDEVPGRR